MGAISIGLIVFFAVVAVVSILLVQDGYGVDNNDGEGND